MSAHNTKSPASAESKQNDERKVTTPERNRLRDMIVVIVTYPLTPSKEANRLAEKKPWLEFVSLLLKAILAAYAIYEAVKGG